VKKFRPAAPPVLPAALAAALSAALMAGLVACSASGSSTTARNSPAGTPTTSALPAADPLADLTATAIMTKAFANIAAASSVHFTETGTGSGPRLSFAFTVVRGQGCAGSISESTTGSFQLINLGKTVWIKPDAAFLKNAGGSGPDAILRGSPPAGKWLKYSTSDTFSLAGMASLCLLSSLFGQPTTSATKHYAKGTRTTLNGQPVLQITDVAQHVTADVTDTANPELLRVVTTGSGAGTDSFADFGAPATITAPPASEVVDGSKYGF
jgi:hypothetical protein